MSDNKQIFAEKPDKDDPWDVVIIGSGPSALTAAIYTTRGAASTLIIAGESWGGQLMLTTEVDNFPGFPDGINGPELMKRMRAQAERFGGEIIDKRATEINLDNKPFEIKTGEDLHKAKSIIIATGAETRWLGVSGEDSLRGRGVSSCAPCDAPFFKDKKVFVVGGGDVAMEEALVLTKYAKSVTIVHRRDELRASEAMQERVNNEVGRGKIDILWDTEVVEMVGDQKLEKLKLKTKADSKKTKVEGEQKDGYVFWEADADGVFVAIGHLPATEIFKGKVELDEKGYVKRIGKDSHGSRTSVEGIFVAGDVHDYHYRQAITAAGYGCMAGLDVLNYLDKQTPSW
ncbi:thioredoxin-disulfide reductase [Candidatus Woesebacteria bacterium]|nr:thioredoxin-disulfide reductase [Candidatus Woesebacteria bacterium]